MKQTVRSFSLALLASSFVAVASAEKIPIDNRFILDGERQMRSWTFNRPESFKPYGEVQEVMENGLPGVRLISAGKQTQVYANISVPAKPGEKYRITAKARGEGSCSIGFFTNGPKCEWRGDWSQRFSPKADMSGAPQEVSFVFTVSGDIASVRPQLCCQSGKADFFDVQLEKLDE